MFGRADKRCAPTHHAFDQHLTVARKSNPLHIEPEVPGFMAREGRYGLVQRVDVTPRVIGARCN
ncbi:MAG TPA: hypothetical protein DCP20_11375 [Coriobacteriia bacterium]|nr:hypothetical protein [Coriobacteriia bacterium]